ncbi:MAG: TIR domain-containing protein [Elainellaceae cyanobacterium]
MNSFQDAFVSYGRKDSKAFAVRLNQRLLAEGLDVWFDFDDIPLGVDFQNQIDDGIEKSHNFLFIISPHSINSPYCLKEIQLALKHNKRVVPLLHVEEIDQALWNERNPSGTDADWSTYCAEGLHSSFVNMHPEIGKINWVYFREGIDDFDAGFQGLLNILHRQQDYVHQHTYLLKDAIAWERQQRQPAYLLEAEDARRAHDWLTTPFDEQPPCYPTDLQAEFITESLKRADGGMTQVFLSYSEENRQQRQAVHRILQRRGFTVWVNTTDIQTGTDFEQAIREGVEKADNVVYLLSPSSLASQYCQQELDFAQTYNKRIIPLLIRSVDEVVMPDELRVIQFIDFRAIARAEEDGDGLEDFEGAAAAQAALDQGEGPVARLIQVLRNDEDYYASHKRFLVKALHWERNRRRKKHLLRGNAFVAAETWLTASRHQNTLPPTRLHEVFIQASQAVNRYFDAFISYGRIDSLQFASRLADQLNRQGLSVWLDKNDIPIGVDFQTQIDDGISKAHNFIFIISPHSVNSPYCLKEIQLALKYSKRIIPLMHVETISYGTWQQRNPKGTLGQWEAYQAAGRHSALTNVHPEIGKINWLFFREGMDNPEAALTSLLNLLRQHDQAVQLHTELLLKALAWDTRQRQPQYLLIGDDRREAEAWLTADFTDEQPPYRPTDLHAEFIIESVKHADGATQVFLCAADEYANLEQADGAALFQPADLLRRALLRAGIPVWNPQTDVQAGENLDRAIARGVEETDNVIFLLSPQALETTVCLEILNQALQLKKRIIPLQMQAINNLKLPSVLKSLRPIWLEVIDGELAATDVQQMIGALRQDAAYYRTHKLLLRKALKWERQKHNPSILLRGNELRRYATWLDVAQSHVHPPTDLQQHFIKESLAQPPDQTVDVFIAAAPEDMEFARRLNQTLQVQSKTTWFEHDHYATEAQDDTQQAIENAENVVVVLSPSAIGSQACLKSVEHAEAFNKRIIPVLSQEVLISKLPPALEHNSPIDFRPHSGDFLTKFGELYRAIESNPQHMHKHTRLLVKAKEWHDAEREDSYLLLKRDRNEAADWIATAEAEKKSPAPTKLHQEYIQASQQLPFRRIKRRSLLLMSLATTVLVGALRMVGVMQGAELRAFDHLLTQRPSEPQDERFLTVTVDQSSGSWLRERMIDGEYEPGIGTVPDKALAEAIDNLNEQGAQLIGIDFYRDFPAESILANQLQQRSNVIGICESTDGVDVGTRAPTELPIERVGFNDFLDDGGNRVRRHFLKQTADAEFCNTQDSFSLILARRYLETREGIGYTDPWQAEYDVDLQFGETVVPQLYPQHSGGYSLVQGGLVNPAVGGYQTMLNFRAHRGDIAKFAPSVSLKDVITGSVPREAIDGRIVLIGYNDLSDRNADYYNTAYADVPGVILQGQMTSQLLSAVLENRPLIWWFALPYNLLWIGSWALVGGVVFWGFIRLSRLIPASVIILGALYGICYFGLAGLGLWLPLVPAAIAYVVSGVGVAALSYRVRHPS